MLKHTSSPKQWTVLVLEVNLYVLSVDSCYECLVEVKHNDSS